MCESLWAGHVPDKKFQFYPNCADIFQENGPRIQIFGTCPAPFTKLLDSLMRTCLRLFESTCSATGVLLDQNLAETLESTGKSSQLNHAAALLNPLNKLQHAAALSGLQNDAIFVITRWGIIPRHTTQDSTKDGIFQPVLPADKEGYPLVI